MSKQSLAIAGLIVLVALSGCASAPDDTAQASAEKGTTHVVICWLKEPGNADARRQLVERSKTFTQIPGIKSVSVGPPLPSTRPGVDSSFDIGIVMHFESEQALRDYDHNPIHQQAVKEVLQPLVKKLVIYDFKNE
jgi:hypothetical protein